MFPKFCLFIEWGQITGEVNVSLNIVPPDGVNLPNVKPSASIKGVPGIVARSMIVLNSFVFPEPGVYTFEFWANGVLAGKEEFCIEKYQGSPHMAN